MSNKSSIGELFKNVFNKDYKKMVVSEKIDVRDYKCHVLSYNSKTKTNEYALVKNIIRKEDSRCFKTYFSNGKTIETSGDHKFYVKMYVDKEPYYEEIHILRRRNKPFYLYNIEGGWIKVEKVEEKDYKIHILDIEVENNHNYYSNGFLSHNTMFGNPTVTTGGNALKFYSSIRIELTGYNSKTETNKEGEKTAKKVKAKCIKNKTCPPFRECEYMIEFGKGIDRIGEVLGLAVQSGVVEKRGGHHSYGEIKLGNGVANVKNLLRDNPELLEQIEKDIFDDSTKEG